MTVLIWHYGSMGYYKHMIRKLQENDINCVADLWLAANIQAHSFIPAAYWKKHYEPVKEMFLQAQLYVFEQETGHTIDGFIGMDEDYIAGIFVRSQAQSHGIGRQLLDYVKRQKNCLHLHVYCKNTRAVRFYQREHFHIRCEDIDRQTGEKELLMTWQSPANPGIERMLPGLGHQK